MPGINVPYYDNNYIQARCISNEFTTDVTAGNFEYDEIVKVDGENVTISLEKA